MSKVFNTTAVCIPEEHYMVNIDERVRKIKELVDKRKYFMINRARQYGKTTTLAMLESYLQSDYYVVSMDFQMFGDAEFKNENIFSLSFADTFLDLLKSTNITMTEQMEKAILDLENQVRLRNDFFALNLLFRKLSNICACSNKPIVLMIDEVDSATNNQVFLDFLAQLRAYYIKRNKFATFQSVILAGIYDVRNLKRKLRPEEEHRINSPWNIATDFDINMSFSKKDIIGMIMEYEADYHTNMNINEMAKLIYNYTFGYPYLVSRFCKVLDEEVTGSLEFPNKSSAWTKEGFLEAEKRIVKEDNTLYQSLIGKLEQYKELKTVLYELLFTGKSIPYISTSGYIQVATMFGFVRNEKDTVVIFNRIFEKVLYNYFISEEFIISKMYRVAMQEKNQFIVNGRLDMKKILEKFVETFYYLYGDQNEIFLEDTGRRYFILFLKPIINGIGNYSIEPETRNSERMDLVVYYGGEQYIIEMKIWRGNAYNERGEEQLSNYLDYFHLKKGYMLSFNFNKKKEIGVKEIQLGDKIIVEAVV